MGNIWSLTYSRAESNSAESIFKFDAVNYSIMHWMTRREPCGIVYRTIGLWLHLKIIFFCHRTELEPTRIPCTIFTSQGLNDKVPSGSVDLSTNDQRTIMEFLNASDPTIVPTSLGSSSVYQSDNSSSLEEAPTLTASASIKASVLCAMAGIALVLYRLVCIVPQLYRSLGIVSIKQIGNSATLISIAVTKRGTSSSLYTLLFQVNIICGNNNKCAITDFTYFLISSILNWLAYGLTACRLWLVSEVNFDLLKLLCGYIQVIYRIFTACGAYPVKPLGLTP